MVSKRHATVWWASFWEKSLPSVGVCSLYPGWEWWAGALSQPLEASMPQSGIDFASIPQLPYQPKWAWSWLPIMFPLAACPNPCCFTVPHGRESGLSKCIHNAQQRNQEEGKGSQPPAEGDVSWNSVHRISVLWILGNLEVHTHLFVPGAWLPSRNKSWTPSYQCRTPGRCLFGEACVKRKSCSGIEWTHGFCHKRLNYVLSPFSSGFLVDSGRCHILS